MRIGASLTTGFADVPPRTSMRWITERAHAAYDAGLTTLAVGDHHALGTSYHQNIPTLARLAPVWPDRELGALFVLPLWHPVLLAEQVGTLAAMVDGPFVLLAALGYGEREFAAMGVSLRDRRSRFEASLSVLQQLFAGDTVELDEPWHIDGAAIRPIPDELPQIWVAGGAAPALDRAARLGDAWVAGPGVTLAEAEDQLRAYRDALARHGRDQTARLIIRRDIHVGATRSEARDTASASTAGGYRGLPHDALIVGDAGDVADAFHQLEAIGFTDVLVRQLARDQNQAIASISRLAEVRARL